MDMYSIIVETNLFNGTENLLTWVNDYHVAWKIFCDNLGIGFFFWALQEQIFAARINCNFPWELSFAENPSTIENGREKKCIFEVLENGVPL